MKKILFCAFILLFLSGCSVIKMEKTYYQRDMPKPPVKKQLSFKNKEAMGAAATLGNVMMNEAYYKGLEPESKEAKRLLDISYGFMDLAGVVYKHTATDSTEALDAYFEETQTKFESALEEKDKNIHKLEEDVQNNLVALATKTKIIKDKEAEMIANNGKWKAKWGSVVYWFWVFVIGGVILLIVGGIIQLQTGIPVVTGLFGGLKMVFKASKQTIAGIQEVKKTLKEQISKAKTDEEKQAYEKSLKHIQETLHKHHDEKTKHFIKKAKAKFKI